jgi:hypothetical protein
VLPHGSTTHRFINARDRQDPIASTPQDDKKGRLSGPELELSVLGTGRAVQTRIEKIKIIYNDPGKHGEDQYGGDPSEDVRPPFPPVIDQQPSHVSSP